MELIVAEERAVPQVAHDEVATRPACGPAATERKSQQGGSERTPKLKTLSRRLAQGFQGPCSEVTVVLFSTRCAGSEFDDETSNQRLGPSPESLSQQRPGSAPAPGPDSLDATPGRHNNRKRCQGVSRPSQDSDRRRGRVARPRRGFSLWGGGAGASPEPALPPSPPRQKHAAPV